ncbi:hypothetical protein CTEN210_00454 [Chaetoceros tenuissimus]|uniref:Uncharacterized protein n=1 Tax=Chaetoceros tenuissimus TaxID=426638 RepID=A0AAD3CG32_9STRA|nr:hypothetical protein CTEN210_00454 [Chaetoceros tenuissimus]
MDNHHQDFDSHLEDDLSYVYDLDGDYSRSAYRGGGIDEEEGGETKALLLKIMSDNKKMRNDYEEKLKAQAVKIQQLEEAISKSNILGSSRYNNSDMREKEEEERDIKLQRLEEAISQMSLLQKSSRTTSTKPMESFDDDYRDEVRLDDFQNEDEDEDKMNVKFAEDVFSLMMISPFCSKENEKFIELLMNFTALFIISQIDDVVFKLVRRGFFCGFDLAKAAASIETIVFTEKRERVPFSLSSFCHRSFLLVTINFILIAFIVKISVNQVFRENYYFWLKHPFCTIADIHRIADGICDGGVYNSWRCKYDEGDCDEFNTAYPNCEIQDIYFDYSPVLGDGICESSLYNNYECGYEFGDVGDGICHGGWYNSNQCNSDARDCVSFNIKYPRCAIDAEKKLDPTNPLRVVPIVGDGICSSGLYNNEDCGFVDGDCTQCNASIEDRKWLL